MCKGICAAYVKSIVPQTVDSNCVPGEFMGYSAQLRCGRRSGTLDSSGIGDQVSLTDGIAHAEFQPPCFHPLQSRLSEGGRSAQSPPGEGLRFRLSPGRVLRPSRCGAGEVRDAAQGPDRRALGHQGGFRLRLFTTHFLRGAGCLRGSWPRRTGPEEAGTSRPTQAQQRGAVMAARASRARRADSGAGPREVPQGAVRCPNPPPHHRACSSKKTLTPQIPELEPGSVVVHRYELLRQGALGEPIPPDARHGLTLLLRRGLWAWARQVRDQVEKSTAEPQSTRPAAPIGHAPDLACILASMVLGAAAARRHT